MQRKKVIECSKLILNTPSEENLISLNITQFLLKWMGATSDYSFCFECKFHKTIKSDLSLTSRYLASMCIFAIEHNHKKADKKFQLESINKVLEYCEDEKNAVKLSKKLKKYIDAKNIEALVDLITE